MADILLPLYNPMWTTGSVNVRDLPSTDGNKLGKLSKEDEVKVTGKCNETGWYRIEYKGSVGYVSASYLTDEEPKEEVVETPSEDVGGGSSSSSEGDENTGGSGLTPGAQAVVEAGYYVVKANPAGGYCVLVKDDSFEESMKGRELISEYLKSIGYEADGGYYGAWIDSDKNQYIISCIKVKEIPTTEEIDDNGFIRR